MLDSTPLGLLTQKRGVKEADECREWLAKCERAGARVRVPQVIVYEFSRDLELKNNAGTLARLDNFLKATPGRLLDMSPEAWDLAPKLWADSYRRGLPLAEKHDLNRDVLLAAAALTLREPGVVLVTSNAKHLSQFVRSEEWRNIHVERAPEPPRERAGPEVIVVEVEPQSGKEPAYKITSLNAGQSVEDLIPVGQKLTKDVDPETLKTVIFTSSLMNHKEMLSRVTKDEGLQTAICEIKRGETLIAVLQKQEQRTQDLERQLTLERKLER